MECFEQEEGVWSLRWKRAWCLKRCWIQSPQRCLLDRKDSFYTQLQICWRLACPQYRSEIKPQTVMQGKAAGELANTARLSTISPPRLLCSVCTQTNAEHDVRVQVLLGVEQQLLVVWQKPRANIPSQKIYRRPDCCLGLGCEYRCNEWDVTWAVFRGGGWRRASVSGAPSVYLQPLRWVSQGRLPIFSQTRGRPQT